MTKTELTKDYTDFVSLRQSAFLKKLSDPLYREPKLGTAKYTNIQRIYDRISQYQLKEVMYKGSQLPEELLFRVFIFDHFKTIHFWEYLKSRDYFPETKTFNPEQFTQLISEYSGEGKLYTTAYMVPPGNPGEPKAKAIAERTVALTKSLNLDIDGELLNIRSGSQLFEQLTKIQGIGDFLASQVVFDLLWHESFKDTQPLYALGVGAVRGAFKLGLIHRAGGKVSFDYAEYALKTALEWVNLSEYPYAKADGLNIPLNVADIQNTFCETDKLFRKLHPEISAGKSAPTKIKNTYKPGAPIDYQVLGWWVDKSGLIRVTA